MKCLLATIRPFVLIGGLSGAFLVLITAVILDFGLGQEIRMISPHDSSTVEINQALYMPGDPVAEVYGNPLSNPVRLIAPDKSHIIRPKEDASIMLFSVDKQNGENPLQARTVWLFTKFLALGLGFFGLTALLFPKSCPVVPA
jgi:hypothetical protein